MVLPLNKNIPTGDNVGVGAIELGGKRPGGKRPGGKRPRGKILGGIRPGGKRPGGKRPGGKRPGGKRPGGKIPGGKRPGGKRPRTVLDSPICTFYSVIYIMGDMTVDLADILFGLHSSLCQPGPDNAHICKGLLISCITSYCQYT